MASQQASESTKHARKRRVNKSHKQSTDTTDAKVLAIVSGGVHEVAVRAELIKLAASSSRATGACFVSRNELDQWVPDLNDAKTGRLPKAHPFAAEYSEKCERFVESATVQIDILECLDDLSAVFAPIHRRGKDTQLMMLVCKSKTAAARAIPVLQKVAAGMQLWLKGSTAVDSDWQVQSLSSILELVSVIEKERTTEAAATETVNQLGNLLGCTAIALGMMKNHRMYLKAISGVTKIDRGSETSRNWRQALVESVNRDEPGLYPAADPEKNFLLQSHLQLASTTHAEAVFSCPLKVGEKPKGAIVFTGPKNLITDDRFERFILAASPAIAGALGAVDRAKRGPISRLVGWFCEKVSAAKRFLLLVAIIGSCFLLMLPITYRVRCSCVTEPVSRRFAVAPFDGQIVTGIAESGDQVKEGEVLAEMDGRTIRWELSGVTAEREQSLRTREMELSERNVPKTILAELEYDRLISEEEILRHKRDHLEIKSPIDGIVLSGSLERAEAASIKTGQVLFEIGPIKPMRIEIAIPADEIAQVKAGFNTKIWIDGQEELPVEGQISKIHPRSETRDAKNVFIAEIEFANDDERLRPGMKGSVRIDGEKRTLGWSLFHKPINWVRSRLTWW